MVNMWTLYNIFHTLLFVYTENVYVTNRGHKSIVPFFFFLQAQFFPKTAWHFSKHYSNRSKQSQLHKCTIFSCRLIHIYCSGEYWQQQDGVCVTDSHQWPCWRRNMRLWLILVYRAEGFSRISSLLVLVFSRDLLTVVKYWISPDLS